MDVHTSIELYIRRTDVLRAQRLLESTTTTSAATPSTVELVTGRGNGNVSRGNLVSNNRYLALFFGAAIILLLLGWLTFSYLKSRSAFSWLNSNQQKDGDGEVSALDDSHVTEIVDLEATHPTETQAFEEEEECFSSQMSTIEDDEDDSEEENMVLDDDEDHEEEETASDEDKDNEEEEEEEMVLDVDEDHKEEEEEIVSNDDHHHEEGGSGGGGNSIGRRQR
ncbi:X-linked retinitis pigmentosa GTPase regulator-interacting protein 1-like [Macrobrachium nipponense]|uniref:X-linked retinitis pigmentosa GTPase regulator-interacting protein 1-like n=1 Tax=Macrobrachium nipponense TaxID=159736 RepID=UPI0030C7AF12